MFLFFLLRTYLFSPTPPPSTPPHFLSWPFSFQRVPQVKGALTSTLALDSLPYPVLTGPSTVVYLLRRDGRLKRLFESRPFLFLFFPLVMNALLMFWPPLEPRSCLDPRFPFRCGFPRFTSPVERDRFVESAWRPS